MALSCGAKLCCSLLLACVASTALPRVTAATLMSSAGLRLADLPEVPAGAGAVLAGGGVIGVAAGAGAAGAGALVAGVVGGVLDSCSFLPHALSISRPARVAQ